MVSPIIRGRAGDTHTFENSRNFIHRPRSILL
nr:MAG TPA: hypothetical protein [Caudoviricetes sp.]